MGEHKAHGESLRPKESRPIREWRTAVSRYLAGCAGRPRDGSSQQRGPALLPPRRRVPPGTSLPHMVRISHGSSVLPPGLTLPLSEQRGGKKNNNTEVWRKLKIRRAEKRSVLHTSCVKAKARRSGPAPRYRRRRWMRRGDRSVLARPVALCPPPGAGRWESVAPRSPFPLPAPGRPAPLGPVTPPPPPGPVPPSSVRQKGRILPSGSPLVSLLAGTKRTFRGVAADGSLCIALESGWPLVAGKENSNQGACKRGFIEA